MNRLTITRRAALTSLALMPILAACGSSDTTPHVDPSASSYGTLRIGYGALREMRAVAHVYARALRQVGYTVELVDTDNSRATAHKYKLATLQYGLNRRRYFSNSLRSMRR